MTLPTGPFGAIYADCPWYWRAYSARGHDRSPPYAKMSLKEIMALPMADIAAKDSVLFIWAIDSMLPQALEVIKAWGFTYKTVGFTWAKTNAKSQGFFTG